MAILVVFWRFLWAKMAKIAPIDFKMGFPTNLKVNDGQTKFKINISKNVAKQWGFWPKMSPTATLARPSDGRNLVIFHPILTFFFFKLLVFSRRIEWWKELSSISFGFGFCFWTPFLLRGLTWAILHVWTQNYHQNVGTCPGIPFQLLTRNLFFQNERPEPPLSIG